MAKALKARLAGWSLLWGCLFWLFAALSGCVTVDPLSRAHAQSAHDAVHMLLPDSSLPEVAKRQISEAAQEWLDYESRKQGVPRGKENRQGDDSGVGAR